MRSRKLTSLAFGATFVFGALLLSACSWTRFNKLKDDAPVVRLLPPDSYKGRFPASLSVATLEDRVELYAAGSERATGGLVFSLGDGEDPEPNPTDESQCPGAEGGDFCDAVLRPTGLNQSWTPSGEVRDLCFVSGFGTVEDDDGLWTRCDDGHQFVIPVPGDTVAALSAEPTEDDEVPRGLSVASNQTGEQILLAGASSLRRAWFYEALSGDPIDVPTPDAAGEDFGASLAVLGLGSGHLLAVTSPDAGQIWLYRAEAGAADPIGCIEGETGLGQTITSGDIDGDDDQDLLVTAGDRVVAYSGAALRDLAGGAALDECAAAGGSSSLELLSLGCESSGDIAGCGASDFGASLAIADVDGDGKGEIFVGAPRIKARGVARAGAALAYSSEGEFTDILVMSDAKEGDELGASLARVPQGDRDIVAVGATGSRELYLFYCAAGSDGAGSARCK